MAEKSFDLILETTQGDLDGLHLPLSPRVLISHYAAKFGLFPQAPLRFNGPLLLVLNRARLLLILSIDHHLFVSSNLWLSLAGGFDLFALIARECDGCLWSCNGPREFALQLSHYFLVANPQIVQLRFSVVTALSQLDLLLVLLIRNGAAAIRCDVLIPKETGKAFFVLLLKVRQGRSEDTGLWAFLQVKRCRFTLGCRHPLFNIDIRILSWRKIATGGGFVVWTWRAI